MNETIPSSLTVYLSNSCNLACSYCYVAVNRGKAVSLDFARLREGVDCFLSRAPLDGRKISFLGGEPLLDYPILRRAIKHIRAEAAESFPVHLFTNGLLLDAARLSFFRDHDVDVTVGFGGGAVKLPSSVHSALKARAGRLGASVVVAPVSVGAFLGHVDFLFRAGFRRISFSPDVGAIWSARDAARLGVALMGFRRYYGALIRAGSPFEIANIYEALAEVQGSRAAQSSRCNRLILAPDGRFYACDKLFNAPLEKIAAWSVGSPSGGLDGIRRRAFIQEALDAARESLGASPDAGCPAGVYFLWQVGPDRSAERLRERMLSFGRVSDLMWGGLLDLAKEFKENEAFRTAHHMPPNS